jgi:hypothetical protein
MAQIMKGIIHLKDVAPGGRIIFNQKEWDGFKWLII